MKFALEFERNGAKFYIDMGIEAGNILTKKLFYTLARQEIEHLEAIEKFLADGNYEKQEGSKEVEQEIKNFMKDLTDERKIETQLQVYEMALDMEKKGYIQYEKFYKEAKDEKKKEFFKFLMNEEKKHIDAIVNVYSYISNTEDWLQREESNVWNWMNL